jgi:hypothetical protein
MSRLSERSLHPFPAGKMKASEAGPHFSSGGEGEMDSGPAPRNQNGPENGPILIAQMAERVRFELTSPVKGLRFSSFIQALVTDGYAWVFTLIFRYLRALPWLPRGL